MSGTMIFEILKLAGKDFWPVALLAIFLIFYFSPIRSKLKIFQNDFSNFMERVATQFEKVTEEFSRVDGEIEHQEETHNRCRAERREIEKDLFSDVKEAQKSTDILTGKFDQMNKGGK